MAKGIHKGTELNNVSETWDQNERLRPAGATGNAGTGGSDALPANDLERVIREEATEYDNDNKEDRLLGGDRASVNDDTPGDTE